MTHPTSRGSGPEQGEPGADFAVLGLQSPILDIPRIHHNHAHLALFTLHPLSKLESHLLMLITEFALPFV